MTGRAILVPESRTKKTKQTKKKKKKQVEGDSYDARVSLIQRTAYATSVSGKCIVYLFRSLTLIRIG